MSIPKVPDLLKLASENESSYTPNEFSALYLSGVYSRINSSGLGGFEFITEIIPKVLAAPLSENAREYRREFFIEIMSKPELRKNLRKQTTGLPEKKVPLKPDPNNFEEYKELERIVRRIIDFPNTLEAITELGGATSLNQDIKRFAKRFQESVHHYFAYCQELKRDIPNVTRWPNEKDRNKLREIALKLEPLSYFVDVGKQLKRQLQAYLLFTEICKDGCKPEFLDAKLRAGRIINGIHPGYWSRDKKYDDIPPTPNDVQWNAEQRMTFILGPNSRGKSVYLRMIGLNGLLAMNGFYALADEMKLSPIRRIWTCFDLGDEVGSGHLETGQRYVAQMRDNAMRNDLLLIDEPSQGTEPAVELALARGLFNMISKAEFNAFIVTHDTNSVKDYRGKSATHFLRSAQYDNQLEKYKILSGFPEKGYGMNLAERLETDPKSLDRIIGQRIIRNEL